MRNNGSGWFLNRSGCTGDHIICGHMKIYISHACGLYLLVSDKFHTLVLFYCQTYQVPESSKTSRRKLIVHVHVYSNTACTNVSYMILISTRHLTERDTSHKISDASLQLLTIQSFYTGSHGNLQPTDSYHYTSYILNVAGILYRNLSV